MIRIPCQMYSLLIGAVFSIVAVSAGALAQTAPKIVFQAGETLTLNVLDRDEFDRDYQIRADGTISVPVLGAIPVAGMDEQQIEKDLGARLFSDLPQDGMVTVERVSYVPIYVLGGVTAPGDFPFRPGLTAQQALAIAGGRFRINGASDGFTGKITELESNLSVSRSNLGDILARRARVAAQLLGSETLAVDEKFQSLLGDNQQLVLEENLKILKQELETFTLRTAAMEKQETLARSNLEKLNAQVVLLEKQIAESDVELERLLVLKERGLAVNERITAASRSANRDRIALMTALAEKSDIELEATQLGDRRRAVISERTRSLTEEMNSLGQEERQARATIKSTVEMIAEFGALTGTVDPDVIKTEVVYTLTRGGKDERILSTDFLLPGDVVTIEFISSTEP